MNLPILIFGGNLIIPGNTQTSGWPVDYSMTNPNLDMINDAMEVVNGHTLAALEGCVRSNEVRRGIGGRTPLPRPPALRPVPALSRSVLSSSSARAQRPAQTPPINHLRSSTLPARLATLAAPSAH